MERAFGQCLSRSAEFDQERRVVSVKDQSLLNGAQRWGKALSNRW